MSINIMEAKAQVASTRQFEMTVLPKLINLGNIKRNSWLLVVTSGPF